jgi:DNA-binding CsgD family transcriptional regulator/transcription antitermination factor NusG
MTSGIDVPRVPPWFALQIRHRYERFVANHLGSSGYEAFLPVYSSRRQWSDRLKEFEVPLFPGYLFCRFDPLDRLPILMTVGVIQVVGIGKKPVSVDDAEITAIQTLVQSGLPAHPWQFLQVGERVRVERGPLSGIEGILMALKGRHRLILSVTLLQRSVAVEVDGAWVSAIRVGLRPTLPSTCLVGGPKKLQTRDMHDRATRFDDRSQHPPANWSAKGRSDMSTDKYGLRHSLLDNSATIWTFQVGAHLSHPTVPMPMRNHQRSGSSYAPARPGFVLVDTHSSPIYMNDEAVRILAYPRGSSATPSIKKLLVQKVQSVFAAVQSASQSSLVARIESGKRHYLCRFFSISRSPGKDEPETALLIERNARSVDLLEKADEFHLTHREGEAVHLLAQGLTSKEIASRMGISPNTVKVFLRLAMVKTGASTRSGIIGRFLRGA